MRIEEFPNEIFVTGTDTGIGKTVVSALLTQGLKATYWKPIQSGLQKETDTQALKRLTSLPDHHFKEETYRLNTPLSPHASAAIDNIEISMNAFSIPDYATDHLIVEGAGGLMVPMNATAMIIDLIKALEIPVLLVAGSELGTLNHTFLSLEALRKRGVPIIGVIMNGPKNKSNRKAIEKYGQIEVLAELEPMPKLDAKSLSYNFNKFFNH